MNKHKILIVDDEDINIDILKNGLQDEYDIFAAKNGSRCLEIMKKINPDIVLLDLVMPEMDGYEVISKIKADKDINEIPIIFLTALKGLGHKTKGFELGAADYVTKPFDIVEVRARVKNHIEIYESKREIQDLLSKTLGGSIQILLEILSLSNPEAFSLSIKIKNLVKKLAIELNLKDIWKLEIAGTLSMLGCYLLPLGSLEKIIKGEKVSKEEEKLYLMYPANGAKLISKIPRLADVAEIIKSQKEYLGNISLDYTNIELMGTVLLNHSLDYELLKIRGYSSSNAMAQMLNNKEKYNIEILNLLKESVSDEGIVKIKDIFTRELVAGMIFEEELRNKEGKLITKKGMIASDILVEYILFLQSRGEIKEKIVIRAI